jgi:hypothetical protein
VNLEDQLRVQGASGAATTGRLTHLTRNEIVIQTDAGQKRFTSDAVKAVALRGHPLRGGTLIGAGAFAVLGAVAICARREASNCAIAGSLGAAPIGAGVGLSSGALIPRMKPIYRAADNPTSTPAPGAVRASPSLLEDLALHVNLDDQLSVEDQSGIERSGRLIDLTADEVTIHTATGDHHFMRATLRQIAVRRQHLRLGTLIGGGTGAIYGAVSECRGGAHDDGLTA